MNKVQLVYPRGDSSGFHKYFISEAEAMRRNGFLVATEPLDEADIIIQRGFTMSSPSAYPTDERMIQGWKENERTLNFVLFADIIKPWTIPFEIVDYLDKQTIDSILAANNWPKVFIRSANTSLYAFGDDISVYPETSLERMKELYEKISNPGPFIIRKFIEDKTIFDEEQRYWVLNGNPYHPSGKIPAIVNECARNMFEFSGSRYFVLDVAGDYIVEVNPGESSDRGGETPLDFFSEIFAKEFL